MSFFAFAACGGTFNGTMGTISSPALSLVDYHHNINCTYHIVVAANTVIDLRSVGHDHIESMQCCICIAANVTIPTLLLHRFNTFHLEASSSCHFDYVAVHDGGDSLAPLLGKFCGQVLPPNLRSSSNQLFLVFKTDSSVSGVGWRATYAQTLGTSCTCHDDKEDIIS